MNVHTKKYLIDGPVGKIEVALDLPDETRENGAAPRGIALVAHPHPLFGGSMDNKVAQTLARTLVQLELRDVSLEFSRCRPNARRTRRGHRRARRSARRARSHARRSRATRDLPLVLAGFSFGTFVLSHVAAQLRERRSRRSSEWCSSARRRAVGTSRPCRENTLVIHGETDETVPIQSVYDWARPQELPVVVIPGAEHFLHRKLHVLKRIIVDAWR